MLERVNQTTQLLTELSERVETMSTSEAVDTFAKIKTVNRATKTLEEQLKGRFKAQEKEGGLDAKGNVYFGGNEAGVKLERRVSPVLKADAASTLQDYMHLFPREHDLDAMEQLLREAGVDPARYTRPALSVKALDDLVERGEIPEDLGLSVLTAKVTLAVKSVEGGVHS